VLGRREEHEEMGQNANGGLLVAKNMGLLYKKNKEKI